MKKSLLLIVALLMTLFTKSFSQTDINEPAFREGKPLVDISGQWFLAHQTVFNTQLLDNQFTLKRGYLTFKKDFNKTFSVRFTQDITLDQEGEDAGNVEMRLKYLYLKVNLLAFEWMKDAYLEIGMVHRPWFEFEEHINDYRVQGPLYLESFKVVNSADFGVNFITLLGGEMDETYQKTVSSSFPGRYGSISFGIFNGGGYHDLEFNNNKTLETRISLRPLPELLPGFQLSYHGAIGKGNDPAQPDYRLNHAYLSYESPKMILALQAQRGLGNSYGTFIGAYHEPYRHRGISLFGELYLYRKALSVVGNFARFEREINGWEPGHELMGGICYHFLNGQKFLIDLEEFKTADAHHYLLEAAIEIRF